ncbi:hypothetical protein DPMN_082125 [Dreissena polymorpha]|uniref:Uncharacterized protein n=1 Tax=Dreissena polymorpha TaxID=45954 RepID=A0A9D3YAB4_DREPO|nr:hypothetical protein DPMN_082125 [Dreissena polymorpha]
MWTLQGREEESSDKLPENQETRVFRKRPPPTGGHETNVLTKFHEDWAKNVSSRLFTCFHYLHIDQLTSDTPPTAHIEKKPAQPPGGHVFPPIMTIFELVQDIYKIDENAPYTGGQHIHEDWTKNVTSRVFTCFHYIHIEKTAPPPCGHVFSPIWTIFELVRDINKTNVLTKFHDHLAKIVTSTGFTRNTAPPPGGHNNILTNLHEDWASNVTSTVFTSRGINGTNVLTKFHEDQTINDDGQKAITKAHHKHVVLR